MPSRKQRRKRAKKRRLKNLSGQAKISNGGVSKPGNNPADGKEETGDQKTDAQPPANVPTVAVDEIQAPPTNSAAFAEQNGENQPTKKSVNWDRWFAVAVSIAAIIEAVVICMQFAIMRKQLTQTQTSLNQTEATLQLMREERRAWIQVNQATLDAGLRKNPAIATTIPLRNTGPTPGTIHSQKTVTMVAPRSAPIGDVIRAFRNHPDKKVLGIVVPPNGTVSMQNTRSSGPFPPTVIDSIEKGELILYLIGEMRYSAGLGREHRTTYLFEYQPSPDGADTLGQLFAREEHSHMD
jgi:hypothetical protein